MKHIINYKILILIFIGSSFLALTSCSGNIANSNVNSKSSSIYGINITGKRIVFVADISGSMEGKAEDGKRVVRDVAIDSIARQLPGWMRSSIKGTVNKQSSKLIAMKRQLSGAIQQLPEAVQFNIVAFSSSTKQWSNKLNVASKANKSSAVDFINRLTGQSGTSISSGLQKAFQFPADQIILISDGEDSNVSPSVILARVKQLNQRRNVVIHTIGLGKDQDGRFLKALAAQNRGKYVRRSSLF